MTCLDTSERGGRAANPHRRAILPSALTLDIGRGVRTTLYDHFGVLAVLE